MEEKKVLDVYPISKSQRILVWICEAIVTFALALNELGNMDLNCESLLKKITLPKTSPFNIIGFKKLKISSLANEF